MDTWWLRLLGNAGFLAILAYLGRELISRWMEKDLARYKDRLASGSAQEVERMRAQLQATASMELERLKSELANIASERQILLARLQDRRASVIGDLYASLAKAIRLTSSFVAPFQAAGEPDQKTKANLARDALMHAHESFDDTRIWLTESCANSV